MEKITPERCEECRGEKYIEKPDYYQDENENRATGN